ncbi:hypothetical protein F5887DRAFT_178828 [Amanita rubescens]|nr:hypothetical protein F5887DRAFT_178828 [Amanita rubescens]
MRSRPPSLVAIITLCLTILAFTSRFVIALGIRDETHASNGTQSELICLPFGICEPCPEDALHEPFCRPFGNRRLMHCVNGTTTGPTDENHSSGTPTSSLDHDEPDHPEGETLAWESCGRIPSRERADFYEFVACNILFTVISLVVLFARSKRLQAIHARQLAARIGLVGNTGRR